MKNKIIKNTKGFTLIELLVVVLIIGILAAIALPKYQLAVAKTKFSELKMFTKNLAGAVQRYYLIHGTYSFDVKDLDIDITNINSSNNTSWFTTKDGMECYTWKEGEQDLSACMKIISGTKIQYAVNRDTGMPRTCVPYSTNKKDLANRICQQETKRTYPNNGCTDKTCIYTY